MTSKQEKLAAARKKLKEFQGKYKEVEMVRQKDIDENLSSMTTKKSFGSFYESPGCTVPLNYDKNFENNHQNFHENLENFGPIIGQNFVKEIRNDTGVLNSLCTEPKNFKKSEDTHLENDLFVQNMCDKSTEQSTITKTISSGEFNTNFKNVLSLNSQCTENKEIHDTNVESREPLRYKNYPKQSNYYSKSLFSHDIIHPLTQDSFKKNSSDQKIINEDNQFINESVEISNLNDKIKSLQLELTTHSQTINLLIQQRNDAENSFVQAKDLLNQKSDEVEKLNQQVEYLSSTLKDLQKKFSETEELIKILELEKAEYIEKDKEVQLIITTLKASTDSKEEKFQEFKRKYEEKNKECEKLQLDLQQTQSQLSLSQIENQQLSAVELSSQSVQVCQLEKENLALKEKINDLKKKLEIDNMNKEQSSQQFFAYAQQCNTELTNLNCLVKSLSTDNENLREKNELLTAKLSELENSKEGYFSIDEEELRLLRDELLILREKNKELEKVLGKKEEEYRTLLLDTGIKSKTINQLKETLKKTETENERLFAEAEIPKISDKLLAVIESEKLAAAKAVSQNQKLKQQIVEFEEAFIKLNEEKLELTNLLASEKHINEGLQKLLKNEEPQYCRKHDHHFPKSQESQEDREPLINDSNEIEELRKIIRQLQDDKVELTSRLVLLESHKSYSEKTEEEKKGIPESEESEAECKSTQLLLRRMEEKVRKTMNEIAVLDEEKEKLEHLVLQLQGETETIGEYIALYQTQRRLLQQRAREKDDQLIQLSKDKEELKKKLLALDELVQHLIGEKGNGRNEEGTDVTPENVSHSTAGKIRALISEIESGSWINSHSVAFEHCSCCSGRLIVI